MKCPAAGVVWGDRTSPSPPEMVRLNKPAYTDFRVYKTFHFYLLLITYIKAGVNTKAVCFNLLGI